MEPGNTAVMGKYSTKRTPRKRYSNQDVKLAGYTLKTKDSLLDVAACLSEKRSEVIKLLEKYLPEKDTELLGELEMANNFALEAAQDVDKLRKSIQNLQKKSHASSPDSAKELDDLRRKIISKLQLFEETHASIQNRLRTTQRKPETSVNQESQTNIAQKCENLTDVKSIKVILKEKPPKLSNEETGNEVEKSVGNISIIDPRRQISSTASTQTKIYESSKEDLSRLYQLYKKKTFSPYSLEKIGENSVISNTNLPLTHSYCNLSEESVTAVYREKIGNIHQKILDQEIKCEDLTRDIRRIESQSGFDLKMLKSGILDRLDELETLPDLLQLTEKRLEDSMQTQHLLETSLQLKIQELNCLSKEVKKLRRRAAKQKSNPQSTQLKQLIIKYQEIEGMNLSLRAELSNVKEDRERLETKLSEKVPTPNNALLEDRVLELERELSKERQRSSLLKDANQNLSLQMTRREEELMEKLESARRRNRFLKNQVHFINSSYHNIFPKEYIDSLTNPPF